MVNCCFGSRWFQIFGGTPKQLSPFHLRGSDWNPNHWWPFQPHKFTIGRKQFFQQKSRPPKYYWWFQPEIRASNSPVDKKTVVEIPRIFSHGFVFAPSKRWVFSDFFPQNSVEIPRLVTVSVPEVSGKLSKRRGDRSMICQWTKRWLFSHPRKTHQKFLAIYSPPKIVVLWKYFEKSPSWGNDPIWGIFFSWVATTWKNVW